MSEYTPWFPHKVKPVHKGVYEVRWSSWAGCNGGPYAYWDGRCWRWARSSVSAARGDTGNSIGAGQDKQWRGLTKPSKA